MEKFYLLDTCGVHNLHGLPGVFSGLVSAIAAAIASETGGSGRVQYGHSLFTVFPARAGAADSGDRHAGIQAGFQLALLASTLGISIFGGLLTGMIVQFLPAFQNTSTKDFYDDEPYWHLADDADKYLPLEEDTKSDGVTNPINIGIELEEIKESPSRSHQHVQTSV